MKLSGSISPIPVAGVPSKETLDALNKLAGDGVRVRFFVEDEKLMKMEFGNLTQAFMCCDIMNTQAFPHQIGCCLGDKTDSVVKALHHMFRFPESFYHFVKYIAEGRVFHDKDEWKVSKSFWNKEGEYEEGYGRELFQTWTERQVSRLNEPRIQHMFNSLLVFDTKE